MIDSLRQASTPFLQRDTAALPQLREAFVPALLLRTQSASNPTLMNFLLIAGGMPADARNRAVNDPNLLLPDRTA
jgi:hypothetical protein